MKFTSTHIVIGVAILGVGLLATSKYLEVKNSQVAKGEYTEFAQCIQDSGATFFGAFWCPHCKEQKELFGDAVTLLPYVECSTPDKQNQTQVCIDENITGYPTWVLKDGERLKGLIPLEALAEKTGCTL